MLLLLLSTSICISAQDSGSKENGRKREKPMFESTNAFVIGQHGATLQLEKTNLYNLYLTNNNRFYLLAGNVLRLAYDGRKESGLIVPFCVAGGLGFSLVNDIERDENNKAKHRTTLDLQALCKQTLFGCFNWKYTELDVAMKFYLDRISKDNELIFGLGYKYNKSHSTGVDDMHCWYVSIGRSF